MIKTNNTNEQWHERDLKIIKDYRPIDDDFMRELFRNDLPLAQHVLRIITGIEDLQLISQETQYDMKRLLGSRSICLDVFGTDSKGRKFDLEIQRDDRGATPQRARYHSSAIDVEFLKESDKFTELPISYVIFITENDVRAENKLIYKFDRIDTESGKPFDDGTHIIYVNGAYDNPDDTSDLAKLVHDFRCTEANEMYTKPLADKTQYLKDTPEGVTNMCKAIEELINEVTENVTKEVTENVTKEVTENVTKEVTENVTKQVSEKNKIQFALNLLGMNIMPKEKIAEATGLSLEDVQKLASQNEPKTA